ncbi:VanZ family protein [Psychroserpens mesophilus]|uniref:VanZ family protein n=1 Tax=Psychroserpens mesophilus TaxID=325473 RepID=UPI000693E360|nr:VanZ family protein [Psychroserpens mesophilus]
MLKRWSLPILLIYSITLTSGSLGRVSSIPKLGSSFDDKIYHFLAYAVLTMVLYNFIATTTVKFKILFSASIAIIYGIIIEGLQSILTDFRTPDYYDVLANTIGVVIAILLLKLKNKLKLK